MIFFYLFCPICLSNFDASLNPNQSQKTLFGEKSLTKKMGCIFAADIAERTTAGIAVAVALFIVTLTVILNSCDF